MTWPSKTREAAHVAMRATVQSHFVSWSEREPVLPERTTEFTKGSAEGASLLADHLHTTALLRLCMARYSVCRQIVKNTFVANLVDASEQSEQSAGPLMHWLQHSAGTGLVSATVPALVQNLLASSHQARACAKSAGGGRMYVAVDPKSEGKYKNLPRSLNFFPTGFYVLNTVYLATDGEMTFTDWLQREARSEAQLCLVLESVLSLISRLSDALAVFDPNEKYFFDQGGRPSSLRKPETTNGLHGCITCTFVSAHNLVLVFAVDAHRLACEKMHTTGRYKCMQKSCDIGDEYPLVLLDTEKMFIGPLPPAEAKKRLHLMENNRVIKGAQYFGRKEAVPVLEELKNALKTDPLRELPETRKLFTELQGFVDQRLRENGQSVATSRKKKQPVDNSTKEPDLSAALYPSADFRVGELCVRYACVAGPSHGGHGLLPHFRPVLLLLFASSCYGLEGPNFPVLRRLLVINNRLSRWLGAEGCALGVLLYLEEDEVCILHGLTGEICSASPSALVMLEEQCIVAHGGWAPDRRQHPVLRLLDVVAEHPLWGDLDRRSSEQWAQACVELYRRRLKPVHDLLQEPEQTQIGRALTYLQNICTRAGRPVTIAPTQRLSQELLGLVGDKLRLGVTGAVHAGSDFLYVQALEMDYVAPHHNNHAFEAPKNRLHGLAAHWNSACVDELTGLSTPLSAPLPKALLSLRREFRGPESAPGRAPGGRPCQIST